MVKGNPWDNNEYDEEEYHGVRYACQARTEKYTCDGCEIVDECPEAYSYVEEG